MNRENKVNNYNQFLDANKINDRASLVENTFYNLDESVNDESNPTLKNMKALKKIEEDFNKVKERYKSFKKFILLTQQLLDLNKDERFGDIMLGDYNTMKDTIYLIHSYGYNLCKTDGWTKEREGSVILSLRITQTYKTDIEEFGSDTHDKKVYQKALRLAKKWEESIANFPEFDTKFFAENFYP